VPLFGGFVSAGVPLGVTFSFLIASPMINEVALGLLFALVGWKVALTYLGFGLAVSIIAGYGIVSTPGIVIDGRVVHAGGLPKAEDLAKWLEAV
jgi:hypothetical protein